MTKYNDEQLLSIAESALELAVETTQEEGNAAYVQARVDALTRTGNLALKIIDMRQNGLIE